jgi:hypothetical protein
MFSGRDGGLFDLVVERVFGRVPRGGEWCSRCDLGRELGVEFGEGWVDDARVGLCEEDGQSASLAGRLVTGGAGDPLDETFAS